MKTTRLFCYLAEMSSNTCFRLFSIWQFIYFCKGLKEKSPMQNVMNAVFHLKNSNYKKYKAIFFFEKNKLFILVKD